MVCLPRYSVYKIIANGSYRQAQDFEERALALDGTLTIGNIPPSPNATLDSIMKLGIPAGGDLPIRVAMSATDNGHCYMYE